MKIIANRLIFDLLLFASACILPWWLTLIFAGFLVLKFEMYVECIFVGFFLDSIYGASTSRLFGLQIFFTTVFSLFCFLGEYARDSLIFYSSYKD